MNKKTNKKETYLCSGCSKEMKYHPNTKALIYNRNKPMWIYLGDVDTKNNVFVVYCSTCIKYMKSLKIN